MIQGDNGTGKTYLACALAACITIRTPILNEIFVQEPGNVIFLSMEDDKNTLVDRIQLSGGDTSKCIFPDIPDNEDITFLSPDIEKAIRDAKAIIFDPFQFFLGSNVDMHRANETRPILAKLVAMCKRNNCTCIIIAHTGKDAFGKSLVNQALGSVDIPAATRSIIHAIIKIPPTHQR